MPPAEPSGRRPPPSKQPEPPSLPGRSGVVVIALTVALISAFWIFAGREGGNLIRYDQFKRYLREDRIEQIAIGEDEISGLYREGKEPPPEQKDPQANAKQKSRKTFRVMRVEDEGLVNELEERGVEYTGVPGTDGFPLLSILFYVVIGFFLLSMLGGGLSRGGGPAGALAFGRSKGKVFQESDVDVSFDDVAGIPEAKQELEEIIEFLKTPERFKALGAKIPKGVLLVGPPGTGKTLLARAVAGEAGVPFISINGSEFVEMFVGVGASRVRDLFDQASKAAPCIVFIDELDAIGRSRGGLGMAGSHNEEREQTLNQLLVELDGFEPNKAVIIMSATNRPEVLDPALLRPGRFDRQVLVDTPDRNGRVAILKVHLRQVPLAPETDVEKIAAQTPGFAGADLRNLVNEAALAAARRGAKEVTASDFSHAIDRVVAGLERRSRIISEDERRRIATHEIGHAITARVAGTGQSVQKISIVPHGLSALGYTRKGPSEERKLLTEAMLTGEITSLLGGRAAERLVYGDISTGAANDLKQATAMARAMVLEYGMSPGIGPVSLKAEGPTFLGDIPGRAACANATNDLVDQEVARLMREAETRAHTILDHNRSLLDELAGELIEQEQLEGPALDEQLSRAQSPEGNGADAEQKTDKDRPLSA
ncbi:MAG: ATP-dependent zinc metalloprotease FtsH [Myxococcales bacterium]|nr:ATP-dependent zinc metalloprotease FtsH [Myxococcales bacterium]